MRIYELPALAKETAYLLTSTRPPERKTVEQFLEAIKPGVEKAADEYGYNVSWEAPSIEIHNVGIYPVGKSSRLGHNLNAGSTSHLSVRLQNKSPEQDVRTVDIHIYNTYIAHSITYKSEDRGQKNQYTYKSIGSLDSHFRRPEFAAKCSKNAKDSISAMIMSEEQRKLFLEQARKRVMSSASLPSKENSLK